MISDAISGFGLGRKAKTDANTNTNKNKNKGNAKSNNVGNDEEGRVNAAMRKQISTQRLSDEIKSMQSEIVSIQGQLRTYLSKKRCTYYTPHILRKELARFVHWYARKGALYRCLDMEKGMSIDWSNQSSRYQDGSSAPGSEKSRRGMASRFKQRSKTALKQFFKGASYSLRSASSCGSLPPHEEDDTDLRLGGVPRGSQSPTPSSSPSPANPASSASSGSSSSSNTAAGTGASRGQHSEPSSRQSHSQGESDRRMPEGQGDEAEVARRAEILKAFREQLQTVSYYIRYHHATKGKRKSVIVYSTNLSRSLTIVPPHPPPCTP
jgi:hypothetical protein